MSKKKWAICLCLMLVLLIMCSSMAAPTFAHSNNLTAEKEKLTIIFENKLHEIDSEKLLEIVTIKELKDFSGNNYTLVECSPTGYMIYHNESGRFLEYSDSAASPYINSKVDNIYYAGPTQYYYLENRTYSNTITGNILTSDHITTLKESSNEMNTKLLNKRDEINLSFSISEDNIYPSRAITSVNVGDSQYFYNLIGCGYYVPPGSNGVCGYIAGGMILHYHYKINGNDQRFMSSTHDGGYVFGGWNIRTSLPQEIRNFGISDSTFPQTLPSIMKNYMSSRGYTFASHTYGFGVMPNTTLSSNLYSNRPIVFFGNWKSPTGGNIDHAFVCYGYNYDTVTDEISYRVHYGWDGYRSVYVSSAAINAFGGWYKLNY